VADLSTPLLFINKFIFPELSQMIMFDVQLICGTLAVELWCSSSSRKHHQQCQQRRIRAESEGLSPVIKPGETAMSGPK